MHARLVLEDASGAAVLAVGLTGGIATGKTTVAGMLREAGLPLVDADAIVHELLAAGGRAVEPVSGRFGAGVLAEDGGIDRGRLGARVFENPEERRALEAIVHPLVLESSRARLRDLAAGTERGLVIYDAALLVETGRHEEFQRLVVVTASAEVQLARLMERDGLTADAAGARIRAQLPLEEKAAVADYVVDNSGRWDDTRRQVSEVVAQLEEDVERLRCGKGLARRRARR